MICRTNGKIRMEIILIANEKGGAGKTTTVLALASCLKAFGYRVLAVDADPSGHLTAAALPEEPPENRQLYHVFTRQCSVQDAIVHAPAFDVLPTKKPETFDMESVDPKRGIIPLPVEPGDLNALFTQFQNSNSEHKQYALNAILRHPDNHLGELYDFVIIDPPPTANLIVTNAIVCADSVVITSEPTASSFDGMRLILSNIAKVRRNYMTDVKVDGLVFTRYSTNSSARRKAIPKIELAASNINLRIYKTRFFNSNPIELAMHECRPLLDYINVGAGASMALNFTLEFLASRGLEPKVDFPGLYRDKSGNLAYSIKRKGLQLGGQKNGT